MTAAWWDDIWLNEAFATWMETKVIERWAPAWGIAAERVEQRNAGGRGRRAGQRPRHPQPVNTYDDVKNAFDSITYEKGAAVLRMFEQWVGPETFRRGIQRYLRVHADGNATARDFLAAISEAAGRDVAPAFDTFLDHPGVPRVQASVRCGAGRRDPGAGPGPVAAGGLHRRSRRAVADPGVHPLEHPGEGAEPLRDARRAPGRGEARGALLSRTGSCPTPDTRATTACSSTRPGAARLARSGKLSDAERVGLLGDTDALVRGGGSPPVRGAAARRAPRGQPGAPRPGGRDRLATVREDFLSGPARSGRTRPGSGRCSGRTPGRSAFRPKPAEDDEVQLVRPSLAEFVARRGEDPQLTAEARSLAEAWLVRPRSVAPEMRSAGADHRGPARRP